jgi:hypothetical protein
MSNQQLNIARMSQSTQVNELTVEQQLANAQQEIDDLKLQIQWLKRTYE